MVIDGPVGRTAARQRLRAGERARCWRRATRSRATASFTKDFPDWTRVQRSLYTDCAIILPDLFFEKVDKATMAHGVEVRVPLVDTRLAAYVMGLPAKYKMQVAAQEAHPATGASGRRAGRDTGPPKGRLWSTRVALAADFPGRIHKGRAAGRVPGEVRPYSTPPLCERSSRTTWRDGQDSGRFLYRLLNLALWYDEYGVAA